MYRLLLKKMCEKVDLTHEEQEIIKKFFTPKKLKKRQFLLEEGSICERFTFVNKGTLVSYSTDERGTEHVISFSFEGWWVGDLVSLFAKEPSRLTIEALEPCELLQLRADQQEFLFAQVPAYERFVRIKYQNACVSLQKRIESSLGLSAEEKYSRLVKQSPVIANKVPLNLIASYLGVTPETLSRVRKPKFAIGV
jgi:CRP-like cAMP-binding protein